MKVKLRTQIVKGRGYYYLDTFMGYTIINGEKKAKRKKKSLGLNFHPEPKTPSERTHNKNVKRLAEQKHLDAQTNYFYSSNNLKNTHKANMSFFDYWDNYISNKATSQPNANTFLQTKSKLIAFRGIHTLINEVDYAYCRDFLSFLQNDLKKNGEKLSSSSIDTYFKKLKLVLKELVNEEVITINPANKVNPIKVNHKRREWLTKEEIQKLIETDCEIQNLKNFYLLSCFTGLRHSDVKKLTWKNYLVEDGKHFFKIYIKKTGKNLKVPLDSNAKRLLENIGRKGDDDNIITGLNYGAWSNLKLQQWGMNAGIKKKITPHTARHTFATNFAMSDGNPLVLQQILGHSDFKATKVYLQMAEEKPFTEIEKMPKYNFD